MAFTWKGTNANNTRTAAVAGENMYGLGGNDTLTGNAAIDQIYGGLGSDSLAGAANNDRIFGDSGRDTLDGGAGNDRMDGGTDNDSMTGGTENDTMYGNTGLDTLDGGAGNDVMRGDSGDDIVRGDAGNDRIDGGSFNDLVEGGAGTDTLYGGTGNDTLRGETLVTSTDVAGDKNTMYAGTGNDSLVGGALGSNVMYGEVGNDTLVGGTIADTLIGGAGADSIDGGTGTDTISYSRSLVGVGINLSTANTAVIGTLGVIIQPGATIGVNYGNGTTVGTLLANSASGISTNTAATKSDASGDTFVAGSIENATGSGKADWILGSTAANILTSLAGNDTITGGDGADTIKGGDGSDVIIATSITDGNDSIDGGSGIDTLDLSALTTAVTVNLSQGTSTGAGTDTLFSIERVIGSSAGDNLTGIGSGGSAAFGPFSVVEGRGGADSIYSVVGSSIQIGGDGADSYFASTTSGTDWFGVTNAIAGGTDTIFGFNESNNDRIYARLTDIGLTAVAATSTTQNAEVQVGGGTGIAFAQYSNVANSSGTYNLLDVQAASDIVLNVTLGSAAVLANTSTANHGQFVYNRFDNGLWYDADGSGAGAAVRVATLDATNIALTDSGVANTFNSSDFEFGNS
jgi:Ca2+-binding RTX toxin-like protein